MIQSWLICDFHKAFQDSKHGKPWEITCQRLLKISLKKSLKQQCKDDTQRAYINNKQVSSPWE